MPIVTSMTIQRGDSFKFVTEGKTEGNNSVFRTWGVDLTKPSVYREGHEYKFNSELTSVTIDPIKRKEHESSFTT